MNLKDFRKQPIIGILRGIALSHVEELTHSIIRSGLRTIEITMNTDDATRLISEVKRVAKKNLTVGAGTVLSREDLKKALDAGATFIVLPNLIEDVVQYCVRDSIPVFPGGFTPQEVYNAWKSGATMVKV
ncbi:MAG: bifunctional 4-hydroxy-2-oxoglutarate aldolase/2-dehydro-3-deoxy-phosphogluconate aldolase, partial [Candidatus Omnitrophica bacterium]|nr:bifunctional 4-hydroxy-2-oxoglutarate aldolase/2-dehydro-3-deoxy-phosphogluconate aldolase [Candidatus Omnitrophota bacterium]